MGPTIPRLKSIFNASHACTQTVFRPLILYRAYASHPTSPETITLDHGPNRGTLDLRIFRSPDHRIKNSRVILYLRSGITLNGSVFSEERIATTLAASANATVVCVDCLGSVSARFPFPIYNVLDAFDWVASHRKFLTDSSKATSSLKIAVCGQLLGGGLAMMLGLTECRKRIKTISAIAVNNPITDWIFPEGSTLLENSKESTVSPSRPSRTTKRSSWVSNASSSIPSANDLLRARSQRFEQPQLYADPFASPILFFRSSGLDYAHSYSQLRSSSPSPSPLPSSAYGQQTSWESGSEASSSAMAPKVSIRKAARTYPPSGSGLILPPIRISSGKSSVLLDQAAELAKRYRRSVMKQNSRRSSRSRTTDRRSSRTTAAGNDEEADEEEEGEEEREGAEVDYITDPYGELNASLGIGTRAEMAGVGADAGAGGFDAEAVAASIAKDQVHYETVKGTGLWGVSQMNDKDGGGGKRSQSFDWEDDVRKTGSWIARVLSVSEG